MLTGFLAWISWSRLPERSWSQQLGVGLLIITIALFADIGQAMAHTAGALRARAPLDEILLASAVPRTLFENKAGRSPLEADRTVHRTGQALSPPTG